MPDDGKIDYIAELQKKLYMRNEGGIPERRVGILRPLQNKVQSTWGTERPNVPRRSAKKPPTAGYKKFFTASIIFLILSMGFLGFSFFKGNQTVSSKNVELTILGSSFVPGGEDLELQVEVANKNTTPLVDAVLTIEYPKGSLDTAGAEIVRLKKDIGTIESGRTRSESFNAVLYGEQGSTRNVKATLEYRLENSNAPFLKETVFAVAISSSPITLTVDAPEHNPANQPLSLVVKTALAADAVPEDLVLKIDYPVGFKFQSSDKQPISGNNMWALDDLTTENTATIIVNGILGGQSSDEKSFRVYVGSRDKQAPTKLAVSYNSILHTILLENPFLEGTIAIPERKGSVIALDRNAPIVGSVEWKNNLTSQLTSPEIVLAISGESVDINSITATGGKYDSRRKAIIWNAETNFNFGTLQAGAEGTLPFSFKTKNAGTGTRPGDIYLTLSVKGKSTDAGFEERAVDAVDRVSFRFIGSANIATTALYSSGPIQNSGPIPPKVNTPTTYTILWTVRPGETAIRDSEFRVKLPSNVGWNGVVSPKEEAVAFSPDSRTVIWKVGTIPQSVGVAQSRTVAFQVTLTPNQDNRDNVLPLTEEGTLSGIDSGTAALIKQTIPPLTTLLTDDPSYKPGDEKVVE